DINDVPDSIEKVIDVEKSENLNTQHNNTLDFSRVSESEQKEGVIIEGLAEALVNHGDLVQKYLMQDAVTVDEHRLTALHTA
ncbi:Fe-S cluster assembly protein SufD, partial [Staphylococcus aureus]